MPFKTALQALTYTRLTFAMPEIQFTDNELVAAIKCDDQKAFRLIFDSGPRAEQSEQSGRHLSLLAFHPAAQILFGEFQGPD